VIKHLQLRTYIINATDNQLAKRKNNKNNGLKELFPKARYWFMPML